MVSFKLIYEQIGPIITKLVEQKYFKRQVRITLCLVFLKPFQVHNVFEINNYFVDSGD